ncbi:MAG: S8 family serine peptidase [Tannerella sp.]|jgi:subtilisin family serine protease|nr:S8 family serine peptidase [Tannerella sp.]
MMIKFKKRFQRVLFFILLFSAPHLTGAEKSFCFRIYLNTKGITSYKIIEPEKFLSPAAIERRLLREVMIDESDFPISEKLMDEIKSADFNPVTQSKWLKTLVVETSDSSKIEQLKQFTYIDSVKCVWNGEDRMDISPCDEDTSRFVSQDSILEIEYGYADNQIRMLNGIALHEKGFKGKNMRIAVIDAGFMNVNRIDAFSGMNLMGVRNITFPNHDFYCDDDHGTKVLSCMAANLPGIMVGTAPQAEYLLIKSEDIRGEFPVEEDFWVAAIEFADSMGVDIISSSLGYYKFDNFSEWYSHEDINGKTAWTSKAAEIAAQKGILLVNSAGNEGNNEWEKIIFPADTENILTVGGVTSDKEKSLFSSVGLTADFRIKPDIVALGSGCCAISSAGQIQMVNGTSFSAPIIAGLAACLWQSFPLLKNTEIIRLLQTSASQYQQPDAQLGYGIPDFMKAYKSAQNNEF